MKDLEKFVKQFEEEKEADVFGGLLMAWNHGPVVAG